MFWERILLGLSSLLWLAIGVTFLLWPVKMALYVDIPLPTPTAMTDLRATYGGFDLAIGIFFGVCALSQGWVRPGLAALALTYAGFGGGRILGLLLDGPSKPLMYQLLAAEMTGLVLSLCALWRTR